MGWWVVVGVLNISSGPFLSYEIELGDGPGPELDNNYNICKNNYIFYLPSTQNLLLWELHSENYSWKSCGKSITNFDIIAHLVLHIIINLINIKEKWSLSQVENCNLKVLKYK